MHCPIVPFLAPRNMARGSIEDTNKEEPVGYRKGKVETHP
jgi:hypothetical protein